MNAVLNGNRSGLLLALERLLVCTGLCVLCCAGSGPCWVERELSDTAGLGISVTGTAIDWLANAIAMLRGRDGTLCDDCLAGGAKRRYQTGVKRGSSLAAERGEVVCWEVLSAQTSV